MTHTKQEQLQMPSTQDQKQQQQKDNLQHCRQIAVGFGRNYYYALGSGYSRSLALQDQHGNNIQKQTLSIQEYRDNDTDEVTPVVECQYWELPPWQASNTNTYSSSKDESNKNPIIQVACTHQSTIFLVASGHVYQTGTLHGMVAKHPIPVTIQLPRKCVQIAAGRHFCLGRMEGGLAVVSWGAGHFGQLGIQPSVSSSSTVINNTNNNNNNNNNSSFDTTTSNTNTNDDSSVSNNEPTPITLTPHPILMERLTPRVTGSPIQSIAAGDWHALALSEGGRVWAWGCNRSNQCGRKSANNSSNSTSNNNGSGSQAPTLLIPLPVPMDTPVMQISAGRSHSLALTRTNKVYAWGAASHGQCGNAVRRAGVAPPRFVEGLDDLNIISVAAGGNHSLALTSGGRVFSWGSGDQGQLGIGVLVSAQPRPRQVIDLDFVAIAAGQEWKAQQMHQQKQHQEQVIPQQQHEQQQQQQQTTPQPSQQLLTNDINAVNKHNIETIQATIQQESVKRQLSETPKITAISAGDAYSVALSSSGHLYSWGSNDTGQVGISTPVNLPFKDNFIHSPPVTSTLRDLHVSTFDSRHDLLLPVRNDVINHLYIDQVSCGPNHMWCIGRERNNQEKDMPQGRTLYEVQEQHRLDMLKRTKEHLLTRDFFSARNEGEDSPTVYNVPETAHRMSNATDSMSAIESYAMSQNQDDRLSVEESSGSVDILNTPATTTDSTFESGLVKNPDSSSENIQRDLEAATLVDSSSTNNLSNGSNNNTNNNSGEKLSDKLGRKPNAMRRLSTKIKRRFTGGKSSNSGTDKTTSAHERTSAVAAATDTAADVQSGQDTSTEYHDSSRRPSWRNFRNSL